MTEKRLIQTFPVENLDVAASGMRDKLTVLFL